MTADPSIVDWAKERQDRVWAVLNGVVTLAAERGTVEAFRAAWKPLEPPPTRGWPIWLPLPHAPWRPSGPLHPHPGGDAQVRADVAGGGSARRGRGMSTATMSGVRQLTDAEREAFRTVRLAAYHACPTTPPGCSR